MIITMKPGAKPTNIKEIEKKIKGFKLKAQISRGKNQTTVGVIGDTKTVSIDMFRGLEGVEGVIRISKEYKLASRQFKEKETIVKVGPNGEVKIGNGWTTVIAGPCAVESEEQLMETALELRKYGVRILRSNIFKPRTSPYAFQGIGRIGLQMLLNVKKETGMFIQTEVMEPQDLVTLDPYVDVWQVGARNMQNFRLLTAIGKTNKPVMLKRGLSATYDEWLLAAEYILKEGNPNVVLCERGIRTYVTDTRNTIDLNGVALLKLDTHLPIMVDPSHGTGKIEIITQLSKASIAVGADGLIVEVHRNPKVALSDAGQQLTPAQFGKLMEEIRPIAKAEGRRME